MGNRLSDLNTHLFAQLDRLSNPNLDPAQIEQEAQRADAIVAISDQIARTADIQLKAAKLFVEHGPAVLDMLPQIGKAVEPKP